MTALFAPLFPGPWSADRMGVVHDADGLAIGAARLHRIGGLADAQATARLFAAAPQLAGTAIDLAFAADDLLSAVRRKSGVRDAAAALRTRQELAHTTLRLLLDPRLAPGARPNADLAALLDRLPGATGATGAPR